MNYGDRKWLLQECDLYEVAALPSQAEPDYLKTLADIVDVEFTPSNCPGQSLILYEDPRCVAIRLLQECELYEVRTFSQRWGFNDLKGIGDVVDVALLYGQPQTTAILVEDA